MLRRKWRLLLHALLIGLALPALGEAISNTETFGGFEFNFNNPGARALGMGGAFLAVADDATAAVTNPAGLPILQRPEISAEVKFTEYTNTIRAFTNTPQEGLAGVYHSRDFDDHVTTPSFFSFVYPTEKLVGAVFVRELINFESDFTTNGASLPSGNRLFPVISHLDITALNFGGGVGLSLAKIHPLLPNLGWSVEFSYGVVDARLDRFSVVGFEPPNFSPRNIVQQAPVSGSDIGVGFNVGALWKPLENLSVGAVFRRGPRFDLQQTVVAITGLTAFPQFTRIHDFTLKVPDVYGAGIAYRLFDRLTLSLDVLRIRYSQLRKNFQIAFSTFIGAQQIEPQPDHFKLDDATEVHVGAEYIFFIRRIPFAVRAGFFTDPDHKIRYTGPPNDFVNHVLFPGGKDQAHFTVGFGVVLPNFQIDFATNQSDTVKEYSISTVYRF